MCDRQNLELRRRQRQQLTGLVEQTDVVSEYYVQPQMTDEQDTRSKHMREYNIGSVRDAVREVMGQQNPYESLDALRSEERADMRKTRLHHSRGTRLAMDGNEVLEFDIAGSSFKQFRSEHLGVKGKSNAEDYMKDARPKWYNKVFGWLPGVKSVKQIKKEALHRAKQSARAKQTLQAVQPNSPVEYTHDENIARRYGDVQRINGKKRKHIRKTVSPEKKNKTRITMAGPLNIFGASNSGDYSIENLREYIKQMGVDYIQQTMISPAWINHPHDIWIRMRGHSRGGVATIEGAMMIKKWMHDNIPGLEHYVKFDITQFDPVPGFGSASGANERVDMTGQNVIREGRDEMMPLGDAAETTVVYSMHSEHAVWFTPQEVAHTKRIILTPYQHGVGLGVTDEQQSSQNATATNSHRAAFTDAATGDAYRLSSLNELPEGIYILDENNAMVQIHDEGQLNAILDRVLKDTSGQGSRHEVIQRVAQQWFASHQSGQAPGAAN
ncbi:MAG: hypothetical protein LIO67_10045 [Lachnospiraceae bacterium]|nr:hypothetical protein [Lachnospiraceae bacterium]